MSQSQYQLGQETGPSGVLYNRDVAYPSEVIPPGGTSEPDLRCSFCGTHPADAPEGVNFDGTPKWNYQNHHCWKCGFNPNTQTSGVSDYQQRQQFAAFQKWLSEQMQPAMQHPTLQPISPDSPEVAAMKQQIADMQAQLANRQPVTNPTSNQADLSQPGTTVSPVPSVPGASVNPPQ